MKALVCKEFDGIDALAFEDVVLGGVDPGQVKIAIEAAALNFPDVLIVTGKYQVKPPLPFTPGMELAGRVTEIGHDVAGIAVGDRVCAVTTWGAFAEEATLDADRVVPVPASMAATTAAAFPLTYMTAYHALIDRAQLTAGETVLVLGAAGGVGLAAIDLCRHFGATVIAAASSDAKLEAARNMGATHCVDYSEQELRPAVEELVGRGGVDIVVDPVGGAYLEPAFRSLGFGGRYLVIGFAAGAIPALPANLALLNERSLLGVYFGDYAQRNPGVRRAMGQTLVQLIEQGALTPLVGETRRLDEAVDALRVFEARSVIGKIALII